MPLSPELIAALRKPPQDWERFLVVADRLQVEGDPRGELIMLQAQRLERGDTPERRAAEAAYIQKHDRALLGRLWKTPAVFSLDWELGFIRDARMSTHDLARRHVEKLSKLTRDLLELESSALIETLTFAVPRQQGVETQALLDALVEVARIAPPTLTTLRVRDLDHHYDEDHTPYEVFWVPVYPPRNGRDLVWHGRPFRVETDAFPIDAIADLLGAWEPV